MKKKISISFSSIKEKNISPVYAIGMVWMILGFLYSMRYIIVHGNVGLFSDISGEMLLADLLNEEHRLITDSWFYSTEVYAVHFVTFLQFGLLLFPHNWYMARITASALVLLATVFSYFYFAKGIGMKEYAPWGAGFLMWPFCNLWLTWNTLYAFNMLFPLLTIGIITNYKADYSRIKKVIMILLGCLMTFLNGMNGPKLFLLCYIPCAGAFLLCLVISAGESNEESFIKYLKKSGSDVIRAGMSLLFLLFNMAGYLYNHAVLSKKYTFMDYDSSTVWLNGRNRSYAELLDEFIRVFGYSPDYQVVSAQGIATLMSLLMGVIMLLCVIWCAASLRRIGKEERPAAAITFIAFTFCFALFCYITGYSNWHWTIQFPFYITGFLILIKNVNPKVKAVNSFVLLVFGACICFMSRNTVNFHVNDDLRLGADDQVEAARYLESEGIKYGMAMAWSSQKIEELTSGEVEMYTVDSYNFGYIPSKWLQRKSHLTPPPSGERIAVVIADLEYAGDIYDLDIVKYGDYTSEKVIGTIHIYIFDSYDRISEAFDKANAER